MSTVELSAYEKELILSLLHATDSFIRETFPEQDTQNLVDLFNKINKERK